MMIIILFLVSWVNGESLASQKTNELREMQMRDGIIELNSTGYFYYTMEFPRPYDIVIYFVAPSCKLCNDLNEQYQKVAKFYSDSGALYKSESKRAVFFATMIFNDKNKQVFEQLGFVSAPNLFVSQPHIVFVPQDERERYLRDMKWSISYTDGTVTAHKFLEFINKRTGRQIDYKASTSEALTVIGILLGALTMGAILFIIGRPLFLNPKLWFIGSIIIFITCLAGVVYNIIHNVPFFTQNNRGGLQWKTNNGRQQIGFEGLFLSLGMTFTGLTMVLILKLKVLVKHQKLDPLLQRLVYLTLFLCIFLIVQFVEDNYRQKSHYNPIFWPPRHYIRGPLNKDQGNSF
ncbi:unnamed protein product [Paramecium sonneborni]|uniref:Magnesium transporter protein 1 n=1 Tax=Paramecium sonneborni TaxID=65129 RepID=A0A8S1PVW3_9CILI|nr:unnamed protein product [Paramecium sonneborni]